MNGMSSVKEDLYRIGVYAGILLGLAFSALFGTGLHTLFVVVLCISFGVNIGLRVLKDLASK